MSDTVIPVERIGRTIYLIRGQKIMLDRDHLPSEALAKEGTHLCDVTKRQVFKAFVD